MKYKYKCQECEGQDPCYIVVHADTEPDMPFRCPWSYDEASSETAEWVRIDKAAKTTYDIRCGAVTIIHGYGSQEVAQSVIDDLCMKHVSVVPAGER